MIEVLNDQNLFTESDWGNWFPSYVQFYSGDHFSKPAAAALYSGKVNHLKWYLSCDKLEFAMYLKGVVLLRLEPIRPRGVQSGFLLLGPELPSSQSS